MEKATDRAPALSIRSFHSPFGTSGYTTEGNLVACRSAGCVPRVRRVLGAFDDVGIASPSLVVPRPGPARDLAQRMQLIVALGTRVLHRDLGAELDVLTDGIAKRRIRRHLGPVERRHVELDEPSALLLGDFEAAVDRDQMSEAQFACEAIGSTEGLDGERSEVVDVFRTSRSKQELEQRVGEYTVVEDLLEAVDCLLTAGVLE